MGNRSHVYHVTKHLYSVEKSKRALSLIGQHVLVLAALNVYVIINGHNMSGRGIKRRRNGRAAHVLHP